MKPSYPYGIDSYVCINFSVRLLIIMKDFVRAGQFLYMKQTGMLPGGGGGGGGVRRGYSVSLQPA